MTQIDLTKIIKWFASNNGVSRNYSDIKIVYQYKYLSIYYLYL